jgi:WD40 repeat protein/class 3 adenylate cyclase
MTELGIGPEIIDAKGGVADRTFLIADIRGYTRFTRERGDAEAARLAKTFAELAGDAIEARDGRVVELRGDEVMAVFASPVHAVRAGVELILLCQEEVSRGSELPLFAGVGIETGPAVEVGEGFRGAALNTAARLCSVAAAGEVLLMASLADRIGDLDGVVFEPRGSAELKGFEAPVGLARARFEGGSWTPRSSAAEQPEALPVELETDFPIAGRERELAWLRGVWHRARRGSGGVVFASGPAGVGKTRLAAELAEIAREDGGRILYVGAGGAAAAVAQASLADAASADVAALLVLDDLDAIGETLVAGLADPAIATQPVLVLGLVREPDGVRGLAQLLERGGIEGGGHRQLGPVDAAAARAIAAVYAGLHVEEAPLEEILRTSAGLPARIHELLDGWAEQEASRRLAAAAEWLAAERLDRRADLDFANNVIGRKLARLYAPEQAAADSLNGACPYKGLASFEAADAPFFFGRERLVGELAARTVGVGLLAVVGASGSGKSSAIAAGLLPSLAAGLLPGSERWSYRLVRPGEHPSRELEDALASRPPSGRWVLVVDQFEEVFVTCCDEIERGSFLDRLLSLADDPERGVVIIGLRGDFYGHCAAHPELARLVAANQVLVGPMTADELRRAVELPARRVGVQVEGALAERLVAEVGEEPGALPLLSTALVELWFEQADARIRLEAHDRLGGVQGAVARLAESTYANLDEDERVAARSILLRLATGEGDTVSRRRVALDEFDTDRDPVQERVLSRLVGDRILMRNEDGVEVAHEALLREWPRLQGWLYEDAQGRHLRQHLAQAARQWHERGRDSGDVYRGGRLSTTLEWSSAHDHELNQLERDFLAAGRQASTRAVRRLRAGMGLLSILLVAAVVAGVLALVQRGQARRSATAALAQSLGAQGVSEPRIDLAMLLARASVALDPTIRTRSDLLTTLLRVPTALRTYHWNTNRNNGVAVSPDGRTLAIDDNDGHTVVEQAATGRRIGTLNADVIGFGPDGSLLTAPSGAVAGRPGVIEVRDAMSPSLKVLRTISFPRSFRAQRVTAGGATVEGGRLAVELTRSHDTPQGPVTDRTAVAQYDYATGHPVAPLITLPKNAAGFSYLDGSRRLIFFTSNASTVIDAKTGQRVRSYSVGCCGATVSPDARTVAFGGGDGSVRFLDLRTGKVALGIGAHTGAVVPMGFTPDGKTLVTSGDDGRTLLWDVSSHTVRSTLAGHAGPIHAQAISADGSTLYTGSFDTNVLGWDLTGRRGFPPSFQAINTDPALSAWTLAISPDSRTFAVGSTTGKVALWNAKTLHKEQTFAAVPGFVSAVAFSRDGRDLLVSGDGGPSTSWLRIWRLGPHPRVVRSITVHGFVTWATWSPDGHTLAATAAASRGDSEHGFVREWDAATGRPLGTSAVKGGYPTDVSFAPSGTAVAISGFNIGAEVVDPARQSVPTKIPVGGLYTFGVAFSPDGTTLASTGWNGTLDLWNPTTGKRLAAIPDPDQGVGQSVAWSPDGRTLALTDGSNTLRLFEVATRREIGPPFELAPGQDNRNPYVSFTPDGTSAVASDDTGRTWVVPVTLQAWEAAACRIANRNLTRAEWREFLPGRHYRRLCP